MLQLLSITIVNEEERSKLKSVEFRTYLIGIGLLNQRPYFSQGVFFQIKEPIMAIS